MYISTHHTVCSMYNFYNNMLGRDVTKAAYKKVLMFTFSVVYYYVSFCVMFTHEVSVISDACFIRFVTLHDSLLKILRMPLKSVIIIFHSVIFDLSTLPKPLGRTEGSMAGKGHGIQSVLWPKPGV